MPSVLTLFINVDAKSSSLLSTPTFKPIELLKKLLFSFCFSTAAGTSACIIIALVLSFDNS